MSAVLVDRNVVAARLGIKPRSVTEIVARGEIEHFRIGKLLRFTEAAIDAYLERQRRPAVAVATEPAVAHEAALKALPVIRKRRLM